MLALIIFTPLDNFVHKLIKMYLNPSKRNGDGNADVPGSEAGMPWRGVWLICRAASNDREKATVCLPDAPPLESVDMWRNLTA